MPRGVHGSGPQTARLAALVFGLASASGRAESVAPGKLLVYYSYPSSINATFTVPLAAAQFAQWDEVILGDGLQSAAHPDHANTVAIIAHPAAAGTRFFGYIDLGVSTQNLPLSEIENRAVAWKTMGVVGVLLDDFGYDFGVTRARQNAGVESLHAQGLSVIANGFFVDDVFGAHVHANNPTGTAAALAASDYYLFESHQIRLGAVVGADDWYEKAAALRAYQSAIGFRVFSVTTNDADNTFSQAQFDYSWYSAALYGHAGTGWGEYLFAASTASAPFRTPPSVDLGRAFLGAVTRTGDRFARGTELGAILVDAAAGSGEFIRGSDADGDGDIDLRDFAALQNRMTGPAGP